MLPKTNPRRISFMLTPLIDVIFLLLIFFMLSSQVAPYSFLFLGGIVGGEAAEVDSPKPDSAALPVVVRVTRGQVRIGNETMAIVDLEAAATRHVRAGADAYLLIPSASATVQDVVSVLEGMKGAAVESVTLLNPGRGGP